MGPLQALLILLFAVSGATCFITISRVSRIPNADVRRGLAGLLGFSGLWAVSELGLLLFSSPEAMEIMYVFGLVVGLPTVGAWLYFCSAYTGHDYHRRPIFRRLAVGVYAIILGVKITNPFHGLYFATTLTTDPFPHLTIQLLPAHWVVTSISYVVTAIGFYLLYELFSQSNLNTRGLSVLVIITGLPAILDILSYTGNTLLTLNYEPVGVAAFSIGAFYIVDEQFVALPAFWRQDVLETLNEPVLVFGWNGQIRDYNSAAATYFPDLAGDSDRRFDTAYPELATRLKDGADLVAIETAGTTRYFAVERKQLTIEREAVGKVVVLSDVTDIEQQRQQLKQQNEQFGDLAVIVTHELRNLLTVVRGHIDMMAAEAVDADYDSSQESYERGINAVERMEQVTTDLAKLARYGQTAQNKERCDLREILSQSWEITDADGVSLSAEAGGEIYGERTYLIDLFHNGFKFMQALDATVVSVTLDGDEIVVTSDGDTLRDDEIEAACNYGEAVPSPETGMLLPMVRAIGRAHGWTIDVRRSDTDSVSLHIQMN